MSRDLQQVLTAARDADPRTRQDAAVVLGIEGTDEIAPAMVACLVAEEDPHVRETLIWAIVARRQAAVGPLLAALATPGIDHERILHTLSKIGDHSTVGAILPFVADPDDVVASKAEWALGRIGSPEGLPTLIGRLGRGGAARRAGLTRALLAYGPGAVDVLVAALDDPDELVRRHALEVLVSLADPDQYSYAERRAGHIQRAGDAVVASEAPEVDDVLRRIAVDDQRPRLAAIADELLARRSATSG